MVDISLGTVKDQLDLFNGSIKKIDINTDISLPQANFDALNELANNTFDVISDLGIADQNDLASAKENFNAIGAQMESLKLETSGRVFLPFTWGGLMPSLRTRSKGVVRLRASKALGSAKFSPMQAQRSPVTL